MLNTICIITNIKEILNIKFIKEIFLIPLVQKTKISLFSSYLLITVNKLKKREIIISFENILGILKNEYIK